MARSAASCQGPARCRGQPCKRAGWVARNRSTRHNRPTGQGGSAWADETCARGRTDVAASRRRARKPLPKRTAMALLALDGCSKRQGILQTCRQEAPTRVGVRHGTSLLVTFIRTCRGAEKEGAHGSARCSWRCGASVPCPGRWPANAGSMCRSVQSGIRPRASCPNVGGVNGDWLYRRVAHGRSDE